MNEIVSLFLSQSLGDFSHSLLLATVSTARVWYSVPLVVVVSLVYGATRHEHLKEILIYSFRSALWLIAFMLGIFAVIWLAGYGN